MLFPVLIGKILKKKVVLILGGSTEKALASNYNILYEPIVFFKKINLNLCNKIIIYSPILIDEWNLNKYVNKVVFAHEHYINFEKFYVINGYEKRNLLIGYIGLLSELKGVFEFVECIPKLLEINKDLKFLIGGDGPLQAKIKDYLLINGLDEHVEFLGWIPHDKLVHILNTLKVLVLPSNTEGLPNIILEAMACGTPVLATSVGAIPDIIKDGETGFIMENNSAECIQKNLLRILGSKNLDTISKNAEKFIKREFNFNQTVSIFKSIFS